MSSTSNTTIGGLLYHSGTISSEYLTGVGIISILLFLMAVVWFVITCTFDIMRKLHIVEEEDEIAMKSLIAKVMLITYIYLIDIIM